MYSIINYVVLINYDSVNYDSVIVCLSGNNILITIRTTQKFHQNRLPVLFDTWINKINGSNVFLVTDREDEEYQRKTSEHGNHDNDKM